MHKLYMRLRSVAPVHLEHRVQEDDEVYDYWFNLSEMQENGIYTSKHVSLMKPTIIEKDMPV